MFETAVEVADDSTVKPPKPERTYPENRSFSEVVQVWENTVGKPKT